MKKIRKEFEYPELIIKKRFEGLSVRIRKLERDSIKHELREKQIIVLLKSIVDKYYKRCSRITDKIKMDDIVRFLEQTIKEHEPEEEEQTPEFFDSLQISEIQDQIGLTHKEVEQNEKDRKHDDILEI